MNKEEMKGNWNEFKGKAKQKWAMLGDDDFALYLEGKSDEFAGRIQKAYGKSKEEAQKEVTDFERSCGCTGSDRAA